MAEETFRDIRYTMSLSRIKLVRLHRGLRQMDLSRRVGISESHLSKIETGRVSPSEVLMDRIAKVLDVGVSDLVGEIESPPMGRLS